MNEPSTAGAVSPRPITLDITAADAELLRTALKLLKTILGRDEADELRAVEALLARLPAPGRPVEARPAGPPGTPR